MSRTKTILIVEERIVEHHTCFGFYKEIKQNSISFPSWRYSSQIKYIYELSNFHKAKNKYDTRLSSKNVLLG